MVRKLVIPALLIFAFLVLPQAATACGSACLYGPDGCSVCTYLGEGTGGACYQYDECTCYDLQCGFAAPPEQGEVGSFEVIGLGAVQPAECSVPAASTQAWSL